MTRYEKVSVILMKLHHRLSPESPRLLLTKGKIDEAEKIIRRIKKTNNEEIAEDFRSKLEEISESIGGGQKDFGVSSIFKSAYMTYILFLLSITL